MTEEVTQQSTETSTAEPTLEQVYAEFKVEPHQETQQVPEKVEPKQERSVTVPDPVLDSESYKAWARANAEEANNLKGTLNAVVQHLRVSEQERIRAKEEADIKQAVGVVNEKLKGEPDFVEIAIAQRARKDPKFMALWQNRGKNPQALEKGLKALGAELAQKFEFRADPQLAENQRAMKEATQTKASGAEAESIEDRLGKLNGRDFDREIARIRRPF